MGWRSRFCPLRWNLTSCEAHRRRKVSDWVDSSPTSAMRALSCGFATGLQPQHGGGVVGDAVVVDEELAGLLRVQVDEARGVGGTAGRGEDGEYSARASWFMATMSCLPLRTHAGASVIAS